MASVPNINSETVPLLINSSTSTAEATHYGTDSNAPIIIIDDEKQYGALSNARLVSLLQEDLNDNAKFNQIIKIYENIWQYSPWYEEKWVEGKAICMNGCSSTQGNYIYCGWKKLVLMSANTLVVSGGMGWITSKVWNNLTGLQDFGMVVLNLATDISAITLLPMCEAAAVAALTQKWLTSSHQATVAKINAYINKIEFFGDSTFCSNISGQALAELKILDSTRRKIVRSLNCFQFFRLKELLGDRKFKQFVENAHSKTQGYYLLFFKDLKGMSIEKIISSLNILKRYVQKDPTLFDEIVKAIHKSIGRNRQVEETLLIMGKEIGKILPIEDATNLGIKVSIEIKTNEGNLPSSFEVLLKPLLQFESLKKKIIHNKLIISEEEVEAHREIFRFIEGTELDLNNGNAVSVMKLANKIGIEDCTRYCYQYLLDNRDDFEIFFFFTNILRHASFPGAKEQSEFILIEKVKQLLQEQDYESVNRLLIIPKTKIGLEIDLGRVAYSFFVRQITREIDNIEVLEACADLSNLREMVEKLFVEAINPLIFKNLLEYSLKRKSKFIKSACKQYLEKQFDTNIEVQAQIYKQWPPGKLPKCLVKLLQQRTKVKLY